VTGVLLGTVVAGEVLGVRQWCGLALVLAGIVLGTPARARARARNRSRFPAGGNEPAPCRAEMTTSKEAQWRRSN
jgi:probable blue pigment (indigoidine) exporter